jgi:hypothetical protein
MTKTEVHNELSQEERRAALRNDRRVREATTFNRFAIGEADIVGGRYSAISKNIVTEGPPAYPALPPGSPFASDPVGPEAPLGFPIDEHESVGTAQEIEASLGDPLGGNDQHAVERPGDGGAPSRLPPSATSDAAPSPSSPKRRKR